MAVVAASAAALGLAGCSDGGVREAGREEVPVESANADELYAQGRFDTAAVLFRRALDTALLDGDSAVAATTLTSLGLTAYRLGDYEEARRLGQRALELKLRLGLRDRLFRSYNALGLLAWSEGGNYEARDLYAKAFEVARETQDTISLAKVSNNLALVLTELGSFADAHRLLLAGLEPATEAGDALVQGRILSNLGMLEIQVGRPLSAIAFLERARVASRRAEDVTGEQNTLGQLGTAYAAIGEPGRALAYLDTALARSRAQGLRQEEASNLEQLAELHRQAGAFRRALDLFAQAEAINEELGLSVETGIDLRSAAEINARLGSSSAALEKGARALEIHQNAAAPFEELGDLLLMAELTQDAGRGDEARAYLDDARSLASSLDAGTARVALALASVRMAEREGGFGAVLEGLDEVAHDLAAGDQAARVEALMLRARAHAHLGALDSAAAAGRLAVAAVEKVRGGFGTAALRTSYAAERAEAYADLVGVLLRLGQRAEAFQVADAARGRALVEHLDARSADSAAASVRSLVEEEKQLLRRIDTLVMWIAELGDSTTNGARSTLEAERERLRLELSRARSDYEAALSRSAEHDRTALGLVGRKTIDVETVQRALLPDEALLQYFVTPEKIILFVSTKDSLRSFESLVSRSTLATRIRIARDLLARPAATRAREVSILSTLHDALIAPAGHAGILAGISRLLIVPHAELNYLPFAALRDPETGRYLAQEYTLTHLPAAAALPELRGRGATRRTGAGASAFAPLPDELPASSAEVRAVRRTVEGARVFRGSRATESAVRRALRQDGIVHLATHGILNVRNPMFSRLELARGSGRESGDDGRLEVHEVVDDRITASLVFLSGCETGLGEAWSTAFAAGEDYATLARAFLYAGADDVIATLWKVEDAGAAAFAEAFYRHLRGSFPAAALAHAQREMMMHERYGSPYYWATYRISGGGRASGRALAAAQGFEPLAVRY
ncbi:MAG: CHAT domain-containing protein [Myxococcota bacterium]